MNFDDENMTMEEAMKDIEKSMRGVRTGEVLHGKVLSVSQNGVIVNIGYMNDGIIPVDDVCYDGRKLEDIVKVDDEIKVMVVKRDDGEGNVLLSKKRADALKIWEELIGLKEKGQVVSFKVKEAVKGGLRGTVKGLNAFMPASLVSTVYIDNLKTYEGRELQCLLTDVDKREQKIIASAKEIEKREFAKKKEEFWSNISTGQVVKGIVRKITTFGAFVDLGGQDGLIHLSEMSWRKIKNPSEVVREGQSIDVYVLDVDAEKKKISLSLKQLGENPWDNIEKKFKVGDVLEGTVAKVLDFGAFVELEQGIEGLVHVSQISHENVSKPSQVLKANDKVKVKVIDINVEGHKISLSMKDVDEKPVEDFSSYVDKEENATSIGDVLKNIEIDK
ncbi:small subunit ribosomal protein S1 [Hathewaya proteolytica DSM 3090]|uniref:Small subunit ribosomal protein S1 n=1 Tax=Hathewaya proteolytica DSM 3090 TaxID=1121331 RepID=A0A1M6QBG7_9CLOT|nr:30S ribosomal protein S1 [Hathewaya proteolytica]SHK17506.1 small subunit ribosomal protein S1 [Hathewaya proteolytica DSM 3090]